MVDGHHFVHRTTDSGIHYAECIYCADHRPSNNNRGRGEEDTKSQEELFSSTNIDDFLQHRSTGMPKPLTNHFQPTGQCSGDLQLPKRRDTGRAQHDSVWELLGGQ